MRFDGWITGIAGLLGVALSAACGSSSQSAAGDGGAAETPTAACSPRSLAEAHSGGGVLLSPQPANGPFSCALPTGQATVDTSIVALPNGDLLTGPMGTTGLMQSTDQGATWTGPTIPPSAPTTASNHPWLWQDAQSHRLFYNLFFGISAKGACSDGSGAALWLSDDEGQTWQYEAVGCGSQDYGQIMTGPAATAADKASLAANNYPNVVYYCATGPQVIFGPDRFCFRSVDGGKTFTRTAGNPGQDAVSNTTRFPHNGAIGADGTVYVAHTSPQGVAIAVSKDDGDSWVDAIVPGTNFGDYVILGANSETYLSATVAVDSAGNVYVVWVDSTSLLPYLAISKDGAQTWSQPVMFGAPGLFVASYPNIVAKDPGEIAVAYYGSLQKMGTGGDGYTTSDGRPYNAYLMVSNSVLTSAPVFWTATVNDPATPVIKGMSYQAGEYLGNPSYAGDTVWAAYADRGKGLAANLGAPPAP